MARCLIVGCGCRGRELVVALRARGLAVRGTTREEATLAWIAEAGAEPVRADPDRLATLVPALDHVAIVVLLLGGATGPSETVRALHTVRLEALLRLLIDTTVRGVVYEARGSAGLELLAAGAEIVARSCDASRIPYELVGPGGDAPTTPVAADRHAQALLGAVERLLPVSRG